MALSAQHVHLAVHATHQERRATRGCLRSPHADTDD
ncbi:hypothetical protein PF003_g34514 [Phytophthora fragariae]|nr:hypothetical protein PF003_g34514 [Phytophthora fragariae]